MFYLKLTVVAVSGGGIAEGEVTKSRGSKLRVRACEADGEDEDAGKGEGEQGNGVG